MVYQCMRVTYDVKPGSWYQCLIQYVNERKVYHIYHPSYECRTDMHINLLFCWECRAYMDIHFCCFVGSTEFTCTYSICCYVLDLPLYLFLPVVYVFSHEQGDGQEWMAARPPLLRRSARSVRVPSWLAVEALPIASDDDSSSCSERPRDRMLRSHRSPRQTNDCWSDADVSAALLTGALPPTREMLPW